MDPRFRRTTGAVSHELDGEVLVLAPGRPDVLHLNSTASDVWLLLGTPGTAQELAGQLAELYAVPAERVLADLADLLPLLVEHGVVAQDAP